MPRYTTIQREIQFRFHGRKYTLNHQYEGRASFIRIVAIWSEERGPVPLPPNCDSYISDRDACIAAEKQIAAWLKQMDGGR